MTHYLDYNNTLYDLSFLHEGIETITASQFIDFKKGDHQYIKSIRENAEGKTDDIDPTGMVQAVYLVTGNKEVLEMPVPVVNAIYDYYFRLFNNWLTELRIKLESKELTDELKETIKFLGNPHVAIEEQIRIAILVSRTQGGCNYTDDKYEFTHNDKEYSIHGFNIDKYYNEKSLKAGQVAIVQNLRKSVKQRLETATDTEGLIEMELSLYEMAVLATEEGEEIPYFGISQDKYLQAKAETFKSMLMPDYYNVVFFLITYLRRSLKGRLHSALQQIFGKDSETTVGHRMTDSKPPLEIKVHPR